jgi:hypothetical protein
MIREHRAESDRGNGTTQGGENIEVLLQPPWSPRCAQSGRRQEKPFESAGDGALQPVAQLAQVNKVIFAALAVYRRLRKEL